MDNGQELLENKVRAVIAMVFAADTRKILALVSAWLPKWPALASMPNGQKWGHIKQVGC